jgi:hypothetical protein
VGVWYFKGKDMHRGYVKVWRMIQDTSFYKRSKVVHLAVHLILEANHKPKKFLFNKEEITIERGQVLTGRLKLKQQTGISEQSIRTCLDILTNTGFLTIKSTNQFSIITINKYNEFQDLNEIPLTSKVTNEQPTTNQRLTTNNNDKNDKHVKEKEKTHYYREHVYMTRHANEKLYCTWGGKLLEEYLDRLDNYAITNPQKFGKYKDHAQVIAKWLKKDNRVPAPPDKPFVMEVPESSIETWGLI